MPVDARTILDASFALNVLAKSYESAGQAGLAEKLFQTAADLELTSRELQDCWGGPFNGQVGREAIMLDLLRLLRPAAVVETGTFRGISLEWFAKNYSGQVLSCEKEKLYFLQAQARLAHYSNVDLWLEDSRCFLAKILDKLQTNNPILVYLDAHWEQDLPLRDELKVIFSRQPKAVAVIDDFRVPDDAGYGWDDYGDQGAIELKLLDGVIPGNAQLFFPILSSSEETGARRGCCIVASESASIVAQCAFLRGNTLEFWIKIQHASLKSMEQRSDRLPESRRDIGENVDAETDTSYPGVIFNLERLLEAQSERLKKSEADHAARLEVINALEQERLRLADQLRESEADRAARLKVINAVEQERSALASQRLALIDRLQITEAERDRSHQNLATRNALLAELYGEIERLGQSGGKPKITENETALLILERTRRIISSRIVRLWSRIGVRS